MTHLDTRTSAVLGNGHVEGLAFADGSRLDCDMVVVAAGIRPNVSSRAKPARRRPGHRRRRRSRVLGDAPDVYAVGECAEHRGRVYGLVAPLWEQTALLADRLTGRNPDAVYTGSRVSTKLKVMGVDLAVMGEKEPVEEDDEVVSYSEPSRGIYKKLIVRNDRLAGAIVIGDGAIVPSLLQTFAAERRWPKTGPSCCLRLVKHGLPRLQLRKRYPTPHAYAATTMSPRRFEDIVAIAYACGVGHRLRGRSLGGS